MLVKDRMTPNPVTITRQTTIAEALELMRSHNIRRLPIMDKGKLVGIVTDRDLSEVSPSPATSLSIFEINYLLAKTKIGDVLPKKQKVYTVSPDAYLEEAALVMRDHQVGAVPVVDAKGQLVGIITETNLFDAFLDIMGVRQPGTRIHLAVEDRPGLLADLASLIKDYGGNITHIVSYPISNPRPGADVDLLIRLSSGKKQELITALRQAGYQVVSVTET
ncbi:MAG: CBS domain-containing protein [Clostridia bacterium]|nr:CBS domain-containing protein [Clostridia bacterium]